MVRSQYHPGRTTIPNSPIAAAKQNRDQDYFPQPEAMPGDLGGLHDEPCLLKYWRREPESNRRTRICNPLHDHSAIAPTCFDAGKFCRLSVGFAKHIVTNHSHSSCHSEVRWQASPLPASDRRRVRRVAHRLDLHLPFDPRAEAIDDPHQAVERNPHRFP